MSPDGPPVRPIQTIATIAIGLVACWTLLRLRFAARKDQDAEPRRRHAETIVQEEGSVYQAELLRRLGGEHGGNRKVLRDLTSKGRIARRRCGKYVFYTPPRHQPTCQDLVPRTARTIREYLRENPGAARREIAEAVGITPAAVGYHARRGRLGEPSHSAGDPKGVGDEEE